MGYEIWRSAVISFLHKQGITDYVEGSIGGGRYIAGNPNSANCAAVNEQISKFHGEMFLSSIRHGLVPNETLLPNSKNTIESKLSLDLLDLKSIENDK